MKGKRRSLGWLDRSGVIQPSEPHNSDNNPGSNSNNIVSMHNNREEQQLYALDLAQASQKDTIILKVCCPWKLWACLTPPPPHTPPSALYFHDHWGVKWENRHFVTVKLQRENNEVQMLDWSNCCKDKTFEFILTAFFPMFRMPKIDPGFLPTPPFLCCWVENDKKTAILSRTNFRMTC